MGNPEAALGYATGKAPVTLLTIATIFLRIGALSFGGGLSGWIYREIVTVRGWITDEEFLADLALSQILPGVNVANMAICIGRRLRGATGAAVAVTSLLVVPFFAVLLLINLYALLQESPWIEGALNGVVAAALGLILIIAFKGARRSIVAPGSAIVFLAVFICIGWLQWPMVPVVAVAATVSVALTWYRKRGGG
jgi:chromate transporter